MAVAGDPRYPEGDRARRHVVTAGVVDELRRKRDDLVDRIGRGTPVFYDAVNDARG